MIKANELRIGNWVFDFNVMHPTEKWVVVETIELEGCILRNERGVYKIKYNQIKPIPLTEEWLLKFGFEQNEFDLTTYDCKWLNFSFSLSYWNSQKIFIYGWIGGNITIRYVHQLQNLYFALTGQELTIKS